MQGIAGNAGTMSSASWDRFDTVASNDTRGLYAIAAMT